MPRRTLLLRLVRLVEGVVRILLAGSIIKFRAEILQFLLWVFFLEFVAPFDDHSYALLAWTW